ncbi:hypothetical protein V8E52_006130 [Russula decolorans]
MEKNLRQTRRKQTGQSRHQVIRIDVLPDDVLLEIFDFYMDMISFRAKIMGVEGWKSLVHVCRRWRVLVFESPRRLNLQLFCTHKTLTRDKLDLWPALPLVIDGPMTSELQDLDNIIAALEQSNRVRQVFLFGLAAWQLEKVLATMQVPFPELTDLQLFSNDETVPVIPDSFLDGSAQRLRFFALDGIPFPGLPKLLLSATNLVSLWLSDIPHSGYISPEAMVALISALSSLGSLTLEFRSPQSRPDWESRRWPPSKRSVIPALHYFRFKGVIEYLEDLVTFIDAPQLKSLYITFFNQIDFDFPRLAQFINRAPTISTLNKAHVRFNDNFAYVGLPWSRTLEMAISCREPDWQLSSIEQVCNSSLRLLSTVEVLYIEHEYSRLVWKNDAIENTLWLQLLLPFTAVKDLYLSKEFAPGIAAALKELVGARITDVLPSLQNIFMEGLEPSGPLQESIGRFVAARLPVLSYHPIAISAWHKDSKVESM